MPWLRGSLGRLHQREIAMRPVELRTSLAFENDRADSIMTTTKK
jgi:hypothetical protein